MAGYKLVEKAKQNQGLNSDNQIAQLIGTNRQNISMWKNTDSKPDAETALLLTELAGVDAKEGRRLLNAGFSHVSLLIMTALVSSALLAPFVLSNTVYYVKWLRFKKVVKDVFAPVQMPLLNVAHSA